MVKFLGRRGDEAEVGAVRDEEVPPEAEMGEDSIPF
jgi:hypothetical protein